MINNNIFQMFTSKLKQAIATFGVDPDTIVLTGGNCKIPKVQQIIQSVFPEKKILNSIDPSEVNAKGAALQARYLDARTKEIQKQETNKLSLKAISLPIGLECNGVFSPFISAHTPVPFVLQKTVPACDSLCINLYEGIQSAVSENKKLLQLYLPAENSVKPWEKDGEFTLKVHVNNNGILTLQVLSQQSILSTVKLEI
jgi:molecular chaperone DnaK (HSP70)